MKWAWRASAWFRRFAIFWTQDKATPNSCGALCQLILPMPFKMMFLPGVILLSISAAVSFKVPPGDSVGQEKMVLDSEHSEKPEGFNLADIIQGNNKMPGMGAWSSIFQRLALKKPIERETLQNMLQSVGGDLAEAYVDPGHPWALAGLREPHNSEANSEHHGR